MQASYAGPLAAYNSLTDEHLAEYFSNPRRLYHLRRMGLITRDGRIVDESVVRMHAAHKEHKQRAKEILATSIVNEAVELEKKRRTELRRKLEMLAKIERVEKVKSQKRHPAGIQEFNPYYSLPPTPPRLPAATLQMTLGSSSFSHFTDFQRGARKVIHSPYGSSGTLTPRPPSAPRPNTTSGVRKRSSAVRRPSTAPPMAKGHSLLPSKKTQIQSAVQITLCYVGRKFHLEGSVDNAPADVLVLQQHCGGSTVTVYKGKVRPKEHLNFTSRRHLGMPFGLTIYLNGMMDCRISACCEYKHQCGSFLGGKSSAHFRLVRVEDGRPCYKCQAKRERLQCLVKASHDMETRPEGDPDELIGKFSQPTDPLESQSEVPSRAVLESDKAKKIGGEHQETRSPTSSLSSGHDPLESPDQVTGERTRSPTSSLSSGHDPLESPDQVTGERTRSPTSSLSSVHSELSPEPKDGSKERKPSDSSSQSSVHSVSSDSIHSATGGEDITPVSASALQKDRVTPSPTWPKSTNDPIGNEKPSLASDPPSKGQEESPAIDTDYSYKEEVFEEEEEGLEPIGRDDMEKTSGEPSGGLKDTVVRQDAQTMTTSAQISQTPDENHISTSAAEKNTGEPVSETQSEEASQDVEESMMTPPSEPVSNSPEMSQEASVSSNKHIPAETKPADSTSKSVLQAQKDETQVPEKAPPGIPAAPSELVDVKSAPLEHSQIEEVDSGISKDGEASQTDADKEEPIAPVLKPSLPELPISVPDDTQKSDTLRSILTSPEKSATLKSSTLRSTLSVSFNTKIITKDASEDEQSSDGNYTPPRTPQEPLSATLTLEDAQNMLKSSSLYSLGSLLRGESEYASTVEVSESEDEDFPDLDRKISQIHAEIGIPPSSSETPVRIPSLSQLSPGRSPSRISQDVTHMADDVIDITPIGSEVGQRLDAMPDVEDTDMPGEAIQVASSHEDEHTSESNTHKEHHQDVTAAISHSVGKTDSQSSSSSLTSVSTSSIDSSVDSSNKDVDQ